MYKIERMGEGGAVIWSSCEIRIHISISIKTYFSNIVTTFKYSNILLFYKNIRKQFVLKQKCACCSFVFVVVLIKKIITNKIINISRVMDNNPKMFFNFFFFEVLVKRKKEMRGLVRRMVFQRGSVIILWF